MGGAARDSVGEGCGSAGGGGIEGEREAEGYEGETTRRRQRKKNNNNKKKDDRGGQMVK